MNVQDNIATVKKIYEAFGRGDVPAILEVMHPEVEWELGAVDKRPEVPWLAARRGREAVVGFFETLAKELRFERFEVLGVMGDGPWVVGLAHVEAVHTGTGRRLVERCEAHIWRFDDAGRVTGMRHGADSLHHAEVAGII